LMVTSQSSRTRGGWGSVPQSATGAAVMPTSPPRSPAPTPARCTTFRRYVPGSRHAATDHPPRRPKNCAPSCACTPELPGLPGPPGPTVPPPACCPWSREALDSRAQAVQCRGELGQITDALVGLRDVLGIVPFVRSPIRRGYWIPRLASACAGPGPVWWRTRLRRRYRPPGSARGPKSSPSGDTTRGRSAPAPSRIRTPGTPRSGNSRFARPSPNTDPKIMVSWD
jgi:hypothetical protein